MAIPAAPAPLATTFISEKDLPLSLRALINPATVTIAVPC